MGKITRHGGATRAEWRSPADVLRERGKLGPYGPPPAGVVVVPAAAQQVAAPVADAVAPARPPTSGPGSGAPVWREYAAAVTGTDPGEWAGYTRDQIIELLDSPEEGGHGAA